MPGMFSGLNHSLEIQACGLIRMPCAFSSPLSSRRQSASQLPRSASLSLCIGRLSSRWSGQDAQRGCGGRRRFRVLRGMAALVAAAHAYPLSSRVRACHSDARQRTAIKTVKISPTTA